MLALFCEKTGHSKDEFNVKSFGCGGGEAAENYDAYLADASNDADIMFVEADWALKYINDDDATKPLSDIGFTDADYADLYDYTLEIGKSTSGVQKGLSWQAAAGGFCYREDLAEKYQLLTISRLSFLTGISSLILLLRLRTLPTAEQLSPPQWVVYGRYSPLQERLLG